MSPHQRPPKQPRIVFTETLEHTSQTVFSFPPNRETLGGTAYLIVENNTILVDCPAWDEGTQTFLAQQGGVDWLVLTHRGAIANARNIQQAFGCKIAIQEQEAYLLPGLEVTSFQDALVLTPQTRVVWTAGHSPGSACVYHSGFGGVLFTGRHLLPNPQGQLRPIKTATTFHWPRQQRNVEKLIAAFTPETLQAVCPGANLGFLRGKLAIADGYTQLQQSLAAPMVEVT